MGVDRGDRSIEVDCQVSCVRRRWEFQWGILLVRALGMRQGRITRLCGVPSPYMLGFDFQLCFVYRHPPAPSTPSLQIIERTNTKTRPILTIFFNQREQLPKLIIAHFLIDGAPSTEKSKFSIPFQRPWIANTNANPIPTITYETNFCNDTDEVTFTPGAPCRNYEKTEGYYH